jgi:hypothetical protein
MQAIAPKEINKHDFAEYKFPGLDHLNASAPRVILLRLARIRRSRRKVGLTNRSIVW